MSFKVIIAGGRHYSDYDSFSQTVDKILANQTDVEIVSGRCSTGTFTFKTKYGIDVYGADGMAERYAEGHNLLLNPFPADWSHGKSAGPKRNQQMADYGDALIAFWDGKSHGTKGMIDMATKKGLKVRVKRY